jgi:hypothetical protein
VSTLVLPAACLLYAACVTGWALWIPALLTARTVLGGAW